MSKMLEWYYNWEPLLFWDIRAWIMCKRSNHLLVPVAIQGEPIRLCLRCNAIGRFTDEDMKQFGVEV